MLANNRGPVGAADVRLVNAEIGACGLRPHVQLDGSSVGMRWDAGDRADGEMLAAALSAVIAAMADGSWRRMKACAAQDCHYAFYDHTRNRSGRWCDVAGCGAKARDARLPAALERLLTSADGLAVAVRRSDGTAPIPTRPSPRLPEICCQAVTFSQA